MSGDVDSLEAVAGGKWTVKTKHSTYHIDLDALTFDRVNDRGNNPLPILDDDEGPRTIRRLHCVQGERMLIVLDDDRWVDSTPVQSITQVQA